jgi:hypothetical protein
MAEIREVFSRVTICVADRLARITGSDSRTIGQRHPTLILVRRPHRTSTGPLPDPVMFECVVNV